jgi:hypothetical protein
MKRWLGLFGDGAAVRRGALFVLCGAAAVIIGYVAVPTVTAGHMIIDWGYYYILTVFSMFVYYSCRLARSRPQVWRGWLRRPGIAGATIAAGTLFAVWSDAFKHKILYDEFVIQGTAYEMHVTKHVSTILRAYNLGGTWLSIDTYLDKRPFFFPFLVSLVHDFTGYRIANMFAVNVVCAAIFLALLFWLTREIAGKRPALLAVAAMATVPLFGQNATGAGMDLHNLTMIVLVACLGLLYLRAPDGDRLSLFVLGAVLLTESRYESVIFIAPTAFVVVAGWRRAGRAILPWPAVIAPLLLIPFVWHHRVFDATPAFWQLKEGQTRAFGLEFVPGNFRGDVDFLFNTGPGLANSLFLTVAGLAGLAYLLWRIGAWLWARPRAPLPAPAVVGLAFAFGVAGHFVVLLFYWWAKFDDLLASRFSLPMYLAFAVMLAFLVEGLARRRHPGLRIAWAGLGLWFLTIGMPAFNLRFYTNNNLGMKELEWEKSVVESRPGPILFVSNKSTIPFILWHTEVLLNNIAALKGDDISYHLSQETFKEVLVTQAIRPFKDDGRMGVDPDDVLPPSFHLQMIAEKRFGGRLDRISRIVSIDPQPKEPAGKDQRPAAPSSLRSISELQSRSDPPVAALTSSALSR